MTRVFTADGPGVVTETDTRQGTTWLYIEGAAMEGWYPAREVTADIGDPGRVVTSPEMLPDPEDGTRLPYDPRARDVFHNQLTIQPTADLPENLTPTDSINGLRFTEPNAVFGSTHPFAKETRARHFADSKHVELGHDFDLDDDAPFNQETLDGAKKDDPYPHVPSDYDDDPPGLDDYGPDYDKKNPLSVNPVGDDGPFKTSAFGEDLDFSDQTGFGQTWSGGGSHPITAPPDPYQLEEQGDGKHPSPLKQADIDRNVPADWNDKASEEFLDNPFTEGWPGDSNDPDASDGDSDDSSGTTAALMDPNVQQVPQDPSHTMTPDGGMQVFSPDMETHDDDPAGQLQSILEDDPMQELAEDIVDDLQGVEVPHQMDDDDLLEGEEVPHLGPGAAAPVGVGPAEVGAADNMLDVGPTGNVPIGPFQHDDDLARMAENFLARTAAKNYSDAEQAALMNESGVAAQLPALRLADSIYDDEPSFLL